jgi:isopentenyldiphosphate isomerase
VLHIAFVVYAFEDMGGLLLAASFEQIATKPTLSDNSTRASETMRSITAA